MPRLLPIAMLALVLASPASAQTTYSWPPTGPAAPTVKPYAIVSPVPVAPLSPPSLVGADGTYLGVLSANKYDPLSVSNPYGAYGSKYSSTSVNNPYSAYGSKYSSLSATNPYATEAPLIVSPYLGRLSTNPYAPDSTSNPYGRYGSPYSPTSITNPYSVFGSRYSPSSVTNPYAVAARRR